MGILYISIFFTFNKGCKQHKCNRLCSMISFLLCVFDHAWESTPHISLKYTFDGNSVVQGM